MCPSRRLFNSILWSTNARTNPVYFISLSIEEKHLAHYTLGIASLMDVKKITVHCCPGCIVFSPSLAKS
ncbi:mCG1040525 [Mus musculus]|nr:mCG1040525 [Mus musculus]